jgi:hypothetical protein
VAWTINRRYRDGLRQAIEDVRSYAQPFHIAQALVHGENDVRISLYPASISG